MDSSLVKNRLLAAKQNDSSSLQHKIEEVLSMSVALTGSGGFVSCHSMMYYTLRIQALDNELDLNNDFMLYAIDQVENSCNFEGIQQLMESWQNICGFSKTEDSSSDEELPAHKDASEYVLRYWHRKFGIEKVKPTPIYNQLREPKSRKTKSSSSLSFDDSSSCSSSDDSPSDNGDNLNVMLPYRSNSPIIERRDGR